MKLIFTEPYLNSTGEFPSWFMNEAFKGYLQYRGVFIGEHKRDWTIEYNKVYHFYDVKLYAIAGNVSDPLAHIQQAIDVLKADGNKIEDQGKTHRWDGKTSIDGRRIWIPAVTITRLTTFPRKDGIVILGRKKARILPPKIQRVRK